MNKQEVIEKLKQHGAWCTECHDTNGEKDRYVKVAKVRELIEQMEEPKPEKVEVTQEFADWFEKSMMWKHNGSWAAKEIAGYGWGAYMHDPETGEELLPKKYPWVEAVQNNKEKHIKAIYDGYTVKPKRWVVKNEEGYYFVAFSKYAKTPFEGVFSASVTDLVTFTDKSKAEAVAVLVEGSVEVVVE